MAAEGSAGETVAAFANPETRDRFRWFLPLSTRWMDNDVYGHVNNVVYYSYVDTVANQYLIDREVLDIEHGPVIGVAVESLCQYRSAIAFPDRLDGGLRVTRLGRSSVRYEVGIFRHDESAAAAVAYFVHVFVDRTTRRPVPIDGPLRAVLEDILIA